MCVPWIQESRGRSQLQYTRAQILKINSFNYHARSEFRVFFCLRLAVFLDNLEFCDGSSITLVMFFLFPLFSSSSPFSSSRISYFLFLSALIFLLLVASKLRAAVEILRECMAAALAYGILHSDKQPVSNEKAGNDLSSAAGVVSGTLMIW
jgi:hypothetical protein